MNPDRNFADCWVETKSMMSSFSFLVAKHKTGDRRELIALHIGFIFCWNNTIRDGLLSVALIFPTAGVLGSVLWTKHSIMSVVLHDLFKGVCVA